MQKITFQGAMGAYSHIACTELFPKAEYIPSDTFEQAMELVDKGEADYAVIPVENSNAGRVTDVHFLLPKAGLHIIGEHFLRIEHQLLAIKGAKLEDIISASSHPQALAQCSEFLKAHNIKAIARIDTAKSCEKIVLEQDKTKGHSARSWVTIPLNDGLIHLVGRPKERETKETDASDCAGGGSHDHRYSDRIGQLAGNGDYHDHIHTGMLHDIGRFEQLRIYHTFACRSTERICVPKSGLAVLRDYLMKGNV